MKNKLLFVLAVMTVSGCAGFGNPHNWIPGVVEEGRQVELVQEGFQFTEGPVGTADGGLYFTDLRASRVHRIDPNGKISVYREPTGEMNGLALTPKGELVGVESAGKRLSRFNPEGPRTELTRGDGVHPLVAPNDLIVDAKGGIYFTDPHNRPIVPGRKHQIYYLPPGELKAIVVDESMTRPNGLTLTLDGKRLIVADTVGVELPVFDVGPDGRLSNKRPYARLLDIKEGADSGADGMAIDSQGRIFVTSATGVQVFDPAGQYVGTIQVPRKPTNVAFAGPGKRILYITAREGLYRLPTLTRGPDRLGK
jgi:gluconolactonase